MSKECELSLGGSPDASKKSDDSGIQGESSRGAAIATLANGVVEHYANDLITIRNSLTELTETQQVLIETVQQENVKFSELRTDCVLDEILNKTRHYHAKLLQIKKDMSTVYELSNKLKKRSLRLQEQKQKEALHREFQREKQSERDKQILAKSAFLIDEKTDVAATT